MDYIEVDIKLNPVSPFSEIIICELGDIGFESFVENDSGLKAYIPVSEFNKENLANIFTNTCTDCIAEYTINTIKEQNWNAAWESNYESVLVDDFCFVHAPFHEKREDVQFNILIEPKMSFGTAHHPTTYLMISFLKDIDLRGKSVLDMGCGTGILAILSSLKGASSIEAIDNDLWAYENTLENVQRNSCKNITVKHGDASLLSDRSFDIILANINRNILLKDISSYAQSLKLNGVLLMSGFFESDIPTIEQEANKHNLSLKEKRTKNDWASIRMEKIS